MIGATFKIMWLRLWRDKGAFALAFLLPGVIFAVFAAIFSTASGGTLDIRVGMALANTSAEVRTLGEIITQNADFDLHFDRDADLESVLEAVRLGQFDVGIYVNPLDAPQPFLILGDPNRSVATTVLKGQLRQIMAEQSGAQAPNLFETRSVLSGNNEDGPSDQSVTYYVGGTAILFLLFSAMQAANITIEERRNGITHRLMLGQTGILSRHLGKLGFMTLIGCCQAMIIVAVADLFFDVPITDHIGPVALACLAAAVVSAAIALLVASFCETQTQMHAVSTFLVLLFSAVGGSMVPRFMMPGWLQDLGVFSPNYWVIEAFYGILARGQSVASLWLVWTVLSATAAISVIGAALLTHHLRRG